MFHFIINVIIHIKKKKQQRCCEKQLHRLRII